MCSKYRTRNGESVRILCLDRNHSKYPVIAMVGTKGEVHCYTSEGVIYINKEHRLDLIVISKYDSFKIDDKVRVRNGYESWKNRYFAGVDINDRPLAWYGGGTSFSANEKVRYNECELVKD